MAQPALMSNNDVDQMVLTSATEVAMDAAGEHLERTKKTDLATFTFDEFRALIVVIGQAFHKEAEIPF